MGLPVYNTKIYESNSYKKVAKSKKVRVTNGKELVCNRKFCSHCIKQNYVNEVKEIAENSSWICMFCQGICFCVTCLRQDMILKLKN